MNKTILEEAVENKAVAISFELEACGYYSGAEYYEQVIMLVEDYNALLEGKELNGDIESGYEIYVGELDGKHSEVDGTVTVYFLTLEDLQKGVDIIYDGDNEYLANDLFNYNIKKCKEVQKKFMNYYETLDHLMEVMVKVPKSKVEEIRRFAESLC